MQDADNQPTSHSWKWIGAILGAAIVAIIAATALFGDDGKADNSLQAATQSAPPKQAPSTKSKPELQAGKSFGELQIAVTGTLGRNPLASDTSDCDNNRFTSESKNAAAIRKKGWIPTAEVTVGGYEAIAFVGKLDIGTSGSCNPTNANVGLFKDGALQAIIYGSSPSFDGVIFVTESPAGKIRLYGDVLNYSTPIADLQVKDNVISISKLPEVDSFCKGTIDVPNIRTKIITSARQTLFDYGWKASPAPVGEYRDPMVDAGVTETRSCSGTGFGLCEFVYVHPSGPRLYVGSMGDDPIVSDFSVDCDPERTDNNDI